MTNVEKSVEEFQLTKELAKQFLGLIEERDFIVEFNDGYNERCAEIDDVEVPKILNQIPSGMIPKFNALVNQID
ncbi:MAG: hypothetical protein ACKPEN_21535 [Planktothrix sp.]|jgi:hypothetical protein|uniref:hypothetical protein n=1 Tax=Planktothrix sp. TaxID=3088171 RepID=UPI0038D4C057